MKLCQFFLPGKGRRTGVIEGSQVIDVTSRKAKISSVVDLIVRGKSCKGIEVTSEEIADPHRLALSCTIWRGGKQLYKGHVNTREMKRSCQELVDWLCRSNVTPARTVLSTGTGIPIPDEYALKDGDVVEIDLEAVGTLRNRVRKLP